MWSKWWCVSTIRSRSRTPTPSAASPASSAAYASSVSTPVSNRVSASRPRYRNTFTPPMGSELGRGMRVMRGRSMKDSPAYGSSGVPAGDWRMLK